uniref:Uncharacterized protein n=1 Tax=Ustilago esculenta TaxID=185366 RepID=A0A481SFL4_9BASI|nr:hypothetical protein UE_1341 [Ustilago esculenta]
MAPSLNNSNNGVHKPMDESADNETDPGIHGHGLPPIFDLVDDSTASSPGMIIELLGDAFGATPSPSQHRMALSPSLLDIVRPSTASQSTQLTPITKHKQGGIKQRCDALANAYYCSSVETLQICLQMEQEQTKW